MATSNLPTLRIRSEVALPDNDQFQFRFQVRSEISNSLYTIAQHKTGKWWGCDCPGWIRHKKCKHLAALGIPNYQQPYEPKIIK